MSFPLFHYIIATTTLSCATQKVRPERNSRTCNFEPRIISRQPRTPRYSTASSRSSRLWHLAASNTLQTQWQYDHDGTNVTKITRQFWSTRGLELSDIECCEAIENMTGFILLLDRWHRKFPKKLK